MSDESPPCGESCACNVEEPDEEQHRMWIDYPEDNNCALKSIEKDVTSSNFWK